MTYDILANEIYNNNIDIIYMNFMGSFKGLYGDNVIAIDSKIDTDAERCCVLAEELGHHHKTSGDITDQTKIENRKQEKIARNWGYEKLVGIADLINAYNIGIRNKNDLAEHLNITEQYLEESIQHYKEKYGLYYEVDNYVVYFDPLGIAKHF
ncbi:ImmA/IrrE family metallo-endopeptidase [Clostridium algidicarnis]|uniref:ImmA/IrrE family metallo-endopeptidase n=1 Tax=Clostridium algidicarnis TaxID=37659 RepID=UPI001C0D3C8B|nr:ImmA/IrrE family metallo-endopeptidase [Clostridium algidicarnis]MBU3226769.1 hypothetical protein [Clostridium algidicarnis]MBU3250320.1 hypothetical protein [Clostridium algidicarnis]